MSGLATTPHRGGETLALSSLDTIISNETYTATFQKPNTAPTDFSPQSTTLLSPHLHFGSLSIRTFYWAVQDVVDSFNNNTQHKQKASEPPTSLTGQLLFRDMYFAAQATLGFSFGQTHGNSHCRFIPWHLQTIYSPSTGLSTGSYSIDSPLAETWFRRWKHGMTGYPFIDALMRQLKQEGWIHHLGRHAVASFLTRGGCYIDWMRGAEVFEEWLIDHETASNIGNWQWLSCTAFFSMFYRVYSPVAFGRKWDPKGVFVRRYVPELEKWPDKWIYEPWKCPVGDQKKAGCLVVEYDEGFHLGGVGGGNGGGGGSNTTGAGGAGNTDEGESGAVGSDKGGKNSEGTESIKTYPKPLFDFPTRRTICLEGMKKAYQVNLYGNDPRVLDGTWRALFDDDKAEGPTEGRSNNDAASRMAGIKRAGSEEGHIYDGEKGKRSRIQGVNRGDVEVERVDGDEAVEEDEYAAADPGTGTGLRAGVKRRRVGGIDENGDGKGRGTGETEGRKVESSTISTRAGAGAGIKGKGSGSATRRETGKKGDKKQMTLDALVSSSTTNTNHSPVGDRRVSQRLKKSG